MLEFGTQFLVTLGGLVFVFGLVVLIHELGHYWAGRLCGAKIEGFSIGFGKPLIARADKRGTKWRLSALPFGGYVSFVSCGQAQKDAELAALSGLAYEEIGPWKRNFISAAGPLANFVLAIALFAGMSMWTGITTAKVMVAGVADHQPAQVAGLQYGDHIVSINQKAVGHPQEVKQIISLSANQALDLEVVRSGEVQNLQVTPLRQEQETALGHKVEMGTIGVQLGVTDLEKSRPGMIGAITYGVKMTSDTIGSSMHVIGRIFTGNESVHMLTGPIGIGDMARRVYVKATTTENVSTEKRVQWSVLSLIHLCALISIGIGFFNILPFPILDGGHIVINTYEAITGSMVPEIVQDYAMRFGMVCLIGLFVYISFGDLWDVGLIS